VECSDKLYNELREAADNGNRETGESMVGFPLYVE
jgi:hypothetical protein